MTMDSKVSILVVEDEEKIRTALTDFLQFQGFEVTEVADGLQAQRAVAENQYDLILLDLMLPKISGKELCIKWRRDPPKSGQIPIIMLTAKGQEKDKITGLNLGADDYITKPFSLEELLARVNAVLRRTDPARVVGQTFKFADLDIDIAALKIKRGDKEIAITKREAAIIQYFAANPNQVIGREELYKKVWNEIMTELGTRTVDMHIAKLRNKIEHDATNPKIVKTVRGVGYKYESK